MFERDKDDLRALGVPVETRELDPLGGEVGYIVDRRAYELADIDLTPDEVAALALALRLSDEQGAQPILSKVTARAPDPTDLSAPVHARVTVAADATEQVAAAVVERQAVRFTYRDAAGAVSDRNLDPYGVAQRRGSWYLVGRDHQRDALRAFRLDRMEGRIDPVGERGAFEVPDIDLGAAVSGPVEETVDIELAVGPAAEWAVEARGGIPTGGRRVRGWRRYRLADMAPWRAAGVVLTLGPHVEVLAPPEVRGHVVDALRAASRRHAATGSAGTR